MEFVGVLIFLALAFYFFNNSMDSRISPKPGDSFTCSTCGQQKQHNLRTIAAWKAGLKRSVCNGCHRDFMSQQTSRTSSGGCFSVFILVAFIPVLATLTVVILFVNA
jgi:hypothetical protein